MGCDIHIVLERNFEGKWIGLRDLSGIDCKALRFAAEDGYTKGYVWWKVTSRDYDLFGALAGVRREKGPEPRGLPDDVSDLAQALSDIEGADGHSHSWGLLSEIGLLFLVHTNPNKILDKDRISEVAALFNIELYDDEEGKTLQDYRLVYWFDN